MIKGLNSNISKVFTYLDFALATEKNREHVNKIKAKAL